VFSVVQPGRGVLQDIVDIIVNSELDTQARAFLLRWLASVPADERKRMVRELREVLDAVEERCVECNARRAAKRSDL
jgi:hypothetical protein